MVLLPLLCLLPVALLYGTLFLQAVHISSCRPGPRILSNCTRCRVASSHPKTAAFTAPTPTSPALQLLNTMACIASMHKTSQAAQFSAQHGTQGFILPSVSSEKTVTPSTQLLRPNTQLPPLVSFSLTGHIQAISNDSVTRTVLSSPPRHLLALSVCNCLLASAWQKSSSSASSEASETCQSVSECSSPTSDWSKVGSHEQSSGATLQRRKDRVELLRDTEPGPASGGTLGPSGEEAPRPRMSPATIAAKVGWPGPHFTPRSVPGGPASGLRPSSNYLAGLPGVWAEGTGGARLQPAISDPQHGEEVSPAASDLAMVLTRGLSLEHQKSSRDSLQYSSGYSTQTTTPSCSEDTIPSQGRPAGLGLSHPGRPLPSPSVLTLVGWGPGATWAPASLCPMPPGSDYDCYSVNGDADSEGPTEFDKSSTIPRNSNIAQNYRRLIQTKRPASTAGLPTAGLPTATGLPSGAPPGVATIRRTPSTKPTVRRALSSAGPIPIRPPIVPVKTPTVPDSPGYMGPTRAGSEECVFYTDEAASPLAPDLAKASPKRLSLPNTAWGSPSAEAAGYPGAGAEDEQQQLAANRHSLVEKLGELVAGAHALGEGQFPFPTALSATPTEETPTPPPAATSDPPAEDMLVAIRRGVRLRRTVTNDRSAPRIL
ncbi:Protein MTSS 2 [Plecturocebus cupreus]